MTAAAELAIDEATVRRQFREWIAERWDPNRALVEWRRMLFDGGLAVPSWSSSAGGRDLPVWADALVASELAAAGAVGNPLGAGAVLAAPTMNAHGSAFIRDRFIRPALTGEERWCQLFSEPDAGSDLAGLTTRAVPDGDGWVIDGQKVWTTSAHHADFGLLLARTDPHAPKHAGITYFVLPMRQPGVEVRPLRQMNGHASFNEVFMTEARVPSQHVVGDVGEGWRVAKTTLAFERRFGRDARQRWVGGGRALDEARREADDHYKTYEWYPQRAGRTDLLIERARTANRDSDPVTRQNVATVITMARVAEWTTQRLRANRAPGAGPGAEGSLGKLASSLVARAAAAAHAHIGGAAGLLSGQSAWDNGVLHEILVSVPAQSIAGGTDEIQRNIIAETILGLPREPSAERAANRNGS